MSRLTASVAAIALAGAAYFVFIHEYTPDYAPEAFVEAHKVMVDGYNAEFGTDFEYATLVLNDWDGPEVGRAQNHRWRIAIRRDAALAMNEQQVADLVAHETAHLIVGDEHSADMHSQEWYEVYRRLRRY